MKIRSFDFEYRDDCFLEGEVLRITDDNRYECAMTRWVIVNKDRKIKEGEKFWTPLPGALVFDWDGRIEEIV
jgi:hypothetical protein